MGDSFFTHQNLEVQTSTAQLFVWREEDCAECMVKQSMQTNKEMSEAPMSFFGSESDKTQTQTQTQTQRMCMYGFLSLKRDALWICLYFPKYPYVFYIFIKMPPQRAN